MRDFEVVAGIVFMIIAVAAHQIYGSAAMARVGGIGLVVAGIYVLISRTVPVGIEGKPPSFLLRGPIAGVIGLLEIVAGALMLVYAEAAACVLGWSAAC